MSTKLLKINFEAKVGIEEGIKPFNGLIIIKKLI